MKITHNTLGIVAPVVTVAFWWLAITTQNSDLGIIAKMMANVALMLTVAVLFTRYMVMKGKEYDPWPILYRDPIALGLVIAGLFIGTAICANGSLVPFG